MAEKTGVFICGCGGNISEIVDIEKLAEETRGEPGVDHVACHELLCAPDGKQFITDTLLEHGLQSAVVAACSPKDHEGTFQRCLEDACVNPHLLQIANIREHCTWVTEDRDQAQEKSSAMVRAATRRVHLHEALVVKKIDCNPDIVVIGGGVAGMEAALSAADAGRTVTLVEAGPTIGGDVTLMEDVAPNMECAPCLLSPRLSDVEEHDNITLLTTSRVDKVVGYLGNFEVQVQKRARMVDLDACIGCDECIQACPVESPVPGSFALGNRKAVYMPFQGAIPGAVVVDRDACTRTSAGSSCNACVESCPFEAMDFEQVDETQLLKAGAIIVATGASPHVPKEVGRFGLGTLPEVYTLAQYERLSSNHGPTGGSIVKADGEAPKTIAVVHCAGREELGRCSQFCCESALKTVLVASHDEESDHEAPAVVHLHTDMVLGGLLGAKLKARAEAKGAQFVRIGDPAATKVESADGGLLVSYELPGGESVDLQADMVVLATGMVPSDGTEAIAEMMTLNRDDDGFLAVDHPQLRPAASGVEGIYLAGTVSGPKNVGASVAQAHAAVGNAIVRVQEGKQLELEVLTAFTDADLCSRCMICVSTCPYKACTYNEEEDVVEVREVLCRGCGTCVPACASGAADARQFTDAQLIAEIAEVLSV